MILHYSDGYDFREVFQKAVPKVLKHVSSSRKQVVPYCTAVLRECSVKGKQATWQFDFSLGFLAIYSTDTIYFAYYLLKLFLTQIVIVQIFITFNYTLILCLDCCHGNRYSTASNFPAKRLRKIRALKIRMLRFF